MSAEVEKAKRQICDGLDRAIFGEHGSGTRWLTLDMRLTYLIGLVDNLRGSNDYLRKQTIYLEQQWKECRERRESA